MNTGTPPGMELRLLMLAARILDPRRWRLRVAQLTGTLGAMLWFWYRSVDVADERRAVRDARRELRLRRVRAKVAEIEQRRSAD